MFEIKTFAFTLLPLLVASLIVLLVNWRIHRKMRGPAYWAGGAAARLLGIMLIAMSGALPEILTNVVGYLLVVFGDFLSVKGLSLFGNRPWYKRTTYVTLLLLVVGFCYYTYVQPEPYHRVMVLVAGHVVSIFLVALLLLHIVRQEGLGGVLILGLSSFWEVFLGPFLLLMMYMASGDVDIEVAIGWVQPMSATAMIGILQTFGFTLLTASRTQRELRDMALLDTLTGIPNRRAFDSAMKRAVEATKRSGTRLGLAVIDIDFFKRVNDNYGHAVGDALLRHVAATVSTTLRDSDFFARIGGEEFALVVEDTSVEALSEVAERFRQAVEILPMQRANDTPLGCTLSAGLALSAPGQIDATQLYASADAALYRAKESGRNRVEMGGQS